METAANQKKGINFHQGVQAFLLSDYSKVGCNPLMAIDENCSSVDTDKDLDLL
jgi:hypothetical protein